MIICGIHSLKLFSTKWITTMVLSSIFDHSLLFIRFVNHCNNCTSFTRIYAFSNLLICLVWFFFLLYCQDIVLEYQKYCFCRFHCTNIGFTGSKKWGHSLGFLVQALQGSGGHRSEYPARLCTEHWGSRRAAQEDS